MKKTIVCAAMSAIFFAANILAAKSNAEKLSNDASLQFGFCRPNLMWVNDKKSAKKFSTE